MLLSERKWHEYPTHLLSSQLTGLLILSVFTVYSSARSSALIFIFKIILVARRPFSWNIFLAVEGQGKKEAMEKNRLHVN